MIRKAEELHKIYWAWPKAALQNTANGLFQKLSHSLEKVSRSNFKAHKMYIYIYLNLILGQICFGHCWGQRTMSNLGALILSRGQPPSAAVSYLPVGGAQRCCEDEGIRPSALTPRWEVVWGLRFSSLSLSSPAGWLHLCGVLRVKDREMWLAKLHSLGEREGSTYILRRQRRKVGVRIIQPSRLINL